MQISVHRKALRGHPVCPQRHVTHALVIVAEELAWEETVVLDCLVGKLRHRAHLLLAEHLFGKGQRRPLPTHPKIGPSPSYSSNAMSGKRIKSNPARTTRSHPQQGGRRRQGKYDLRGVL